MGRVIICLHINTCECSAQSNQPFAAVQRFPSADSCLLPLFFQLEGHNEAVTLQVFVGNDSGRVKPHGFYQACRVMGRNTTPCKEVDIEGTTVIEVGLDPNNNMTLA